MHISEWVIESGSRIKGRVWTLLRISPEIDGDCL